MLKLMVGEIVYLNIFYYEFVMIFNYNYFKSFGNIGDLLRPMVFLK